jgi:aminomethyltransferase
MSELQQTVFHDWHVAQGGRMVEFGGWHMPVQYSTIVEEHHAVRRACGLFDIAHMGRLRFTGPDACRFLDHLTTNDITKLKEGAVRYALVTNEQGGVLDDVLVYRLPDCFMLVVNASNRLKIVDWIAAHRSGFAVAVEDLTLTHAMQAVQGPQAVAVLNALNCPQAATLGYYTSARLAVSGVPAIVSRTGYTGEDGFEIIVENAQALAIWEQTFAAGQSAGLRACGLGCRDTLRLEAAMPLYGHELNETTDPLTAGLSFAVKLEAGDFIGRSALRSRKERGVSRTRVGLELQGKRIAREGATVMRNGAVIGDVTSGTFSPTLEKSIAMAFVDLAHSATGTEVVINIREKLEPARIVPLPFYRRADR